MIARLGRHEAKTAVSRAPLLLMDWRSSRIECFGDGIQPALCLPTDVQHVRLMAFVMSRALRQRRNHHDCFRPRN